MDKHAHDVFLWTIQTSVINSMHFSDPNLPQCILFRNSRYSNKPSLHNHYR